MYTPRHTHTHICILVKHIYETLNALLTLIEITHTCRETHIIHTYTHTNIYTDTCFHNLAASPIPHRLQALSTRLSITSRSCSRVPARLLHRDSFLRVWATSTIT